MTGSFNSLEDRMKLYESAEASRRLMPTLPVIARLIWHAGAQDGHWKCSPQRNPNWAQLSCDIITSSKVLRSRQGTFLCRRSSRYGSICML